MQSETILWGDYLDHMIALESQSIDLCVFSPTYDEIRHYDGHSRRDLGRVGTKLYSITRDGGACAVVIRDAVEKRHSKLTGHRMIRHWRNQSGWSLHSTILYHKITHDHHAHSRELCNDHEYALIFFKGKCIRTFNQELLEVVTPPAAKTDRNAMETGEGDELAEQDCRAMSWAEKYDRMYGVKEFHRFKSPDPDAASGKLAENLILLLSQPGDLVYDPMARSGGTLVAAARNRRHFLGSEINENYIPICQNRLKHEIPLDIKNDEGFWNGRELWYEHEEEDDASTWDHYQRERHGPKLTRRMA